VAFAAPAAEVPRKLAGGLADGLALSISSGLGAFAGLVSWLVATRILPTADVGRAAAVVTALLLVGGICQLNLGLALMRWLPAAGRHAPTLVWRAHYVILPLSALAGLGWLFAVPELAATSAGEGPVVLGAVAFALATAGWGVFLVHDYVLVAVGHPWWSVWRNALFAVSRIVLLVLLGLAVGAQGVVLSWAIPIVLWITVGIPVLSRAVRRFAARTDDGMVPRRGEVLAFLTPTWAAQVGNTLLLNQVPLLVILRFGPEPGAVFFIVWQAGVVIETAATFFTHALSARCARTPGRAPELCAAAHRQLLTIFLPLLAVAALVAGPALSIFGPVYGGAADVLRLLLLGQGFRLLVLHELGVRTAAGQAMAYARLHLASTLLVLVAILLLPATTGRSVDALFPVAWSYVAVQAGCALHVVVMRWRAASGDGPGDMQSGVRHSPVRCVASTASSAPRPERASTPTEPPRRATRRVGPAPSRVEDERADHHRHDNDRHRCRRRQHERSDAVGQQDDRRGPCTAGHDQHRPHPRVRDTGRARHPRHRRAGGRCPVRPSQHDGDGDRAPLGEPAARQCCAGGREPVGTAEQPGAGVPDRGIRPSSPPAEVRSGDRCDGGNQDARTQRLRRSVRPQSERHEHGGPGYDDADERAALDDQQRARDHQDHWRRPPAGDLEGGGQHGSIRHREEIALFIPAVAAGRCREHCGHGRDQPRAGPVGG
jgi:O-antigen/teichoic acid export membrane protein